MYKIGDRVKIGRVSDSRWGDLAGRIQSREGTVIRMDSVSVQVNVDGHTDHLWFLFEEVTLCPPRTAAFWMVLGDGTTYTKVRHQSRASAEHEASRLAKQNPGKKFFILKMVGTAEARCEVELTTVEE